MVYLRQVDPDMASLIDGEAKRQSSVIRLIASENYASKAVLEASGTILTNKYSEGYPYRRYYQGQEFIDQIEELTINRIKKLFKAEHVNVQPYSGSPANMAVYLGLLGTKGKILGMDLAAGGHLTHGAKVSASGKYYDVVQYGLSRETGQLDYDQARALAKEHKPDMIVCGASAYPRKIDFAAFAEIAKEVGAYLMADISHFSGLCVSGDHPSPIPYCDAVTTTTHKLLRGPRGGMIMCKPEHAAKIDKAVFPGLQGGPHNHAIAALGVCIKEADTPEFMEYCHQVVRNSKALAEALMSHGFDLVTGGTDNHVILMDLTSKGVSGNVMATAMDKAGVVGNSNKIPFDPRPANDPSGVRIGTPAITSRGFKEAEMKVVADLINEVVASHDNDEALASIKARVAEMCADFPAPGFEE